MNLICIFGVFVADICFFGNKIPAKGETILGNNYIVGPGGKGSNQAIAAARLNGEVNFITKVGKDSHADMAFSLYKEAGVNVDYIIQDPILSTGVAGIMIDENGNNAINVFSGAAAHLKNEDIDKNLELIKKSKIFLTQMETPDSTTIYAIKKAKENDCLTILNPAPARKINKDDFKLLDFFTPNETEAEFYLNKKIDTEQDIKNAAADFLNMGVKNIIITLGEKGSYFANENEEYLINAFELKNEVVDTTGAGDAFNGALAVALAKDFTYKDAILFANKVAGISTTRLGAAVSMPLLKKVEEY
ncbi:ribokinase [Candidatus Pelagibacter ubique]|jgi:ribokinase|uniref:ribokinase n=1 Tax=Pelagibacter ubique TaxID=198252 RepID=UPI0003C7E2FA